MHLVFCAVTLAFTLGIRTRVTSLLALVIWLSYLHRVTLVTGEMEPVLSMLLLYLCIGPAGANLSVDRWRSVRAAASKPALQQTVKDIQHSISATVSVRLIQLHLCGFYLLMALTKLQGEPWWDGTAVWWLLSRTESRWVDLTWLHSMPILLDLWGQAIVFFEIAFAILIWHPMLRPLLVALASVHCLLLALASGWVGFFSLLFFANLVYLAPSTLREWVGCFSGKLQRQNKAVYGT